MQKLTLRLLAVSLLLSFSLPAVAQDAPPRTDGNETEIYLGAAVLSTAEYAGSDEQQLRAFPYFEVYNFYGFDFRPFALTYDVIDLTSGEGLWATGFKAGGLASYDFGREEDDGPELAGLGDLDGSLIGGGYGQLRLGPVALRIEGGQAISGGHQGARFDMSLGTRIPIGEGTVTAALTSRWGSEDFNQSYFGISAEQAVASQFDAYVIDSGIYSNGATVLLSYPVGETWNATALASYQKYAGDTADSPIITAETGSDTATTLVLAMSRKFNWNR